ncbi:MAG: hypothetical protein ACREBU_20945, partial [Nitrososphaera sp.]
YVEPSTLIGNPAQNEIERRIASNIEEVKKLLIWIRKFRKTHQQIFRRYKHAGFPVFLYLHSKEPYPKSSKTFPLYSMIPAGKDSSESYPLPYSDEVIESYKCLIPTIKQLLFDIVENKLACLERGIDRIIPFEDYTPESTSEEDKSIMSEALNNFYKNNPVRARVSTFKFGGKYPDWFDMSWYSELDYILSLCRKTPRKS